MRAQSSSSLAIQPAWLGLSLALSPPVLIGGVMLLALGILPLARAPIHPPAMLLAGALSVIVGWLAVLPMIVLIGRGAVSLLRCAMFANMTRLAGIGIGAVLAVLLGPEHLNKMDMVAWLVVFYFVLLIGQSAVCSWVIKHTAV